MNNQVYIKMDTFEITDNIPGYFSCDKEIAESLALLNEKGYQTRASCAGHNKSGSAIKYSQPIEVYEEWQKEFGSKVHPEIVKIDTDVKEFTITAKQESTFIYIMFNEKYDFPDIENGFFLEESVGEENCTIIRKCIHYYKDDKMQELKKDSEIELELKMSREYLLNWIKKLEIIEKRGR